MSHDPRDPEQLAASAAAAPRRTSVEQELERGLAGLRALEKRAQAQIRRYPLRSAGLAFAAGYLIAVVRRL